MQFSWHLTAGVNHRLVNFKQGIRVFQSVSRSLAVLHHESPWQEQNASQCVVGSGFSAL